MQWIWCWSYTFVKITEQISRLFVNYSMKNKPIIIIIKFPIWINFLFKFMVYFIVLSPNAFFFLQVIYSIFQNVIKEYNCSVWGFHEIQPSINENLKYIKLTSHKKHIHLHYKLQVIFKFPTLQDVTGREHLCESSRPNHTDIIIQI